MHLNSLVFLSSLNKVFCVAAASNPDIYTAARNKSSWVTTLWGQFYKWAAAGILPLVLLCPINASPARRSTQPPQCPGDSQLGKTWHLCTPAKWLQDLLPASIDLKQRLELTLICGKTWLKVGFCLRHKNDRLHKSEYKAPETQRDKREPLSSRLVPAGLGGISPSSPIEVMRGHWTHALISQLAELSRAEPCRWDLVLPHAGRVLLLALVEPGFHNAPYSTHSEVTGVIHVAELLGALTHVMQKGRLEQGASKINITQQLPAGTPFRQLLAMVMKLWWVTHRPCIAHQQQKTFGVR